MIYQISYDLKGTAEDYNRLYDAIRGLGQTVDDSLRILESTWLVHSRDTALTEAGIIERLRGVIKSGDRFFVSRINSGQYNGWHAQTTWTWIQNKLNS